MAMDFQPVVMAAGRGSRMTDLTSQIPKPLLPIGNKPMIWYTVDMLEKAGFQDVIIVVLKSVLRDVKQALEEVVIRLEYVTLSDDNEVDEMGTADALRQLRDKVKGDMLILSSDLIVDENMKNVLFDLADSHHTNNATVSMLLTPVLQLPDTITSVPGGRAHLRIEKDVIGLDKTGRKVLFLAADSDVEQITFQVSQLRRFPFVQLNTGLVDSHVYFLNHSVFDVLAVAENRSLSTIKGDLIPFLVKKQLSGKKHPSTVPVVSDVNDDVDDKIAPDFEQLVREMSTMGNSARRTADLSRDRDDVICCAKILDEGLCIRANTILSYCEANKRVTRLLSSQGVAGDGRLSHSECVIGEGVTIGEKCTLKCTVVGDQSSIGERTKITNCVIMDHVTIEPGTTLTGCIVCSNACISSGAQLRDCLVGVKQSISGKHTNAMLLEQDHMMI